MSTNKRISFFVQELSIQCRTRDDALVDANVNVESVISEFSPEEILINIDRDEFLSIIGEDYCKQYFGIEQE